MELKLKQRITSIRNILPGNIMTLEKMFFYILLTLSFFTVLYIYISANATYDNGDGISHYLIARYSWIHPRLFLYQWGKPFFTLVSSPFAQFGLNGMYVFQSLNAALISWFLFSIANRLNLRFGWIIPLLVFFAPIYFGVMNSGLTEVFFGTVSSFSFWLIYNKRYYASALVASLLPFVRPEAYVVIPLLLFIYVYRRKFWAIPLLLTATVIYSIIGYFYYKDILWIITQNYKLAGDNYPGGKGSFLHYFPLYDKIWGSVYTVLLITGIIIIIWQLISLMLKRVEKNFQIENFILFLGSLTGLFLLHTLLNAMPGILNNLGMVRYMAVLIPVSAMIALIGLNLLNSDVFARISFLRPVIACVVAVFIVKAAFSQWFFPFRPNCEQAVINEMCNYILKEMPEYKLMYYKHPLMPVYASFDPYDPARNKQVHSPSREMLNALPDSSLVIWDSHFFKGEGQTPLATLEQNPNFKKLYHIRFADSNLPYEACLFMKVDSASFNKDSVSITYVSSKGLIQNDLQSDSSTLYIINTQAETKEWYSKLKDMDGKSVLEFSPGIEYGPKVMAGVDKFVPKGNLNNITIRFKIFPVDSIKELITVVETRRGDEVITWDGLVLKKDLIQNEWNQIEYTHWLKKPLKVEGLLSNIYLWNKGKSRFYVCDFSITFKNVSTLND